jgi:hypothetical protein
MNLRYRFKFVRIIVTALAVLLVALMVQQSGNAQVLYGSIVGNVNDKSDAVVAGATVKIIHKETNQIRETTTRADGSFNFSTVQTGTSDAKALMSASSGSVSAWASESQAGFDVVSSKQLLMDALSLLIGHPVFAIHWRKSS